VGAPSPSLSGGTTSPSLRAMSKLVRRFSAEMLQPYSGMPESERSSCQCHPMESVGERARTVVHDAQEPPRPVLLRRDEEEVVDVAQEGL